MFAFRISLVLLLAAFCLTTESRAQPVDEPFNYRQFLSPPKTTPEFWEAMQFEMEVGRFDLAAQHLHSLVEKKPTPDELVKLHEKEGIANFLRLRIMPKWFEDRNKDRKAREDVETLIDLVTQAVHKKLTDPNRIKLFIANLYETPEENAYARIQLAESGSAAVPLMLDELQRRPVVDRGPIIDALSTLRLDTVRPLLAALDVEDDVLRLNVLEIIRKRRDLFSLKANGIELAPALWPLASPAINRTDSVRRKAREILAYIFDLRSPDHLQLPLLALTAEAERYYYHRVRFSDPRRVALWRVDGKKVIEDSSFTPSKAEEFLGLRYARQALQINPHYQPAQIVMLSMLVDKGYQAPTADRPLGTLKPTVDDLLLKVKADLLNAVLDIALRDERTFVILSAIRALGRLGDVRALIPQTQGEPALVRALHYGDRRVQMAAVDAILHIPGSSSVQASSRIVNILKGKLTPDAALSARPRVLVASTNTPLLRDMAKAVDQTGSEPVVAVNGRDAIKRLLDRSDIDAVLLDGAMRNPDLSWVLAQLRADQGLRRLPVLVASVPDNAAVRDVIEQLLDIRARSKVLDEEIRKRVEDRERLEKVSSYLSARAGTDVVLVEQRKQRKQLEGRIQGLNDRYEAEGQKQNDLLRRHIEKNKHVWVIAPSQATDTRLLANQLEDRIRESGMPPLSKVERKEYAEQALAWLAKMATGELAGFSVRPAGDAVIDALQNPGLSETAQLNAIRILGRLPGAAYQGQLIRLALDDKRAVVLRASATEELLKHIQEFGRPTPAQEREMQAALEIAIKQAGIDPVLRDRLTRLLGALRPGDRTTGQKLRGFMP